MPAYNAAAFIGAALDSVCGQSYTNLEILVVDDGSYDGTVAIVEAAATADPRIRLIRQANGGVAAARNRAIEASRGAFVAPIDADDLWHSEKIERQVACMLASGPPVGLVYTWWGLIDESGRIAVAAGCPEQEGEVFEALVQANFIGNASVPLIRRACLDRVGGYDAGMRARGGQGCEDWDLALRIAEHYEFRVVRDYLTAYRKVDQSMSTLCDAMERSYRLMIGPIRQRHPEVADALYRRSRSGFNGYLAQTSFIDGHHGEALRWALKAWRLDPAALLNWRTAMVVATSLPLAVARPLVARLWPKRHTWLRLRRTWARLRRRPDVHFTLPPASPADVRSALHAQAEI